MPARFRTVTGGPRVTSARVSDGVAKKGRVIDKAALELAFTTLLKKMIAGFGPCDLYLAQR